MKKNVELKNGASALNFVESLEKSCTQLENWCEEMWRIYGKYGMARTRMQPSLQGAVSAAKYNEPRQDKDSVQNHAWLIAYAKFAERMASRYGIELN